MVESYESPCQRDEVGMAVGGTVVQEEEWWGWLMLWWRRCGAHALLTPSRFVASSAYSSSTSRSKGDRVSSDECMEVWGLLVDTSIFL